MLLLEYVPHLSLKLFSSFLFSNIIKIIKKLISFANAVVFLKNVSTLHNLPCYIREKMILPSNLQIWSVYTIFNIRKTFARAGELPNNRCASRIQLTEEFNNAADTMFTD